jgi:hypothetical protein
VNKPPDNKRAQTKAELELDRIEAMREFLLAALRAGATRARLIEQDINAIGIALKTNQIGVGTAVQWIRNAGLLYMVGELPSSVAQQDIEKPPEPKQESKDDGNQHRN